MFLGAKKKDMRQAEGEGNSMIGPGTIIEGSLYTSSNIRLEGTVLGNVTTKAKIVLGKTAKIIGELKAMQAEISGEVSGGVAVVELLSLRETARVEGDIRAQKLVFDAGAVFNGKCRMGEETQNISLENPKEKKMTLDLPRLESNEGAVAE